VWEVGIFLGLLKIDGISSARALGSIDCLALFWGVLEADVQDSACISKGRGRAVLHCFGASTIHAEFLAGCCERLGMICRRVASPSFERDGEFLTALGATTLIRT
jgi:hypothetical protein